MEHQVRELGPGDLDMLLGAAHLFDHPVRPEWAQAFLASPTHHLLVFQRSWDGVPAHTVGFVTGVETTHPDKGTEMFVYELGVEPAARREGVATALVSALREVAERRGCYGMWVATDIGNLAARRTYAGAGGTAFEDQVVYVWDWTARRR